MSWEDSRSAPSSKSGAEPGLAPSLARFRSSGDLLADRRYGWAEAALEAGDAEAAADLAAQALERAPAYAPALLLLGRARLALGGEVAAQEAFEQVAALDPQDHLGARAYLARLGAVAADEALSEGYVRALFDDYAPRFDSHLVEALAYRGPQILRAALDRACRASGRPFAFAQAVDLGCGTGLMGRELRPAAGRLTGCDLSPAMIARARAAGVYDELRVGELVGVLRDLPAGGADLVTAADVLVYVGDLGPTFAAVAAVLRPGGLFAFSVQAGDVEDRAGFRLGEDLRFAHGRDYLLGTAATAGLAVDLIEPASTRLDRGRPVPGLVAVLRRE